MDKREELYERKRQAMRLMNAGKSWREANEQSGLHYSRTGIQGLYRAWCARGEEALIDHRHGHSYKVTSEMLEWMTEHYTEKPAVQASGLATEIKAQFGIELESHYVNVLRHQLGLPVPRPGRPSRSQSCEQLSETESEADFSPG
jgi:transposase